MPIRIGEVFLFAFMVLVLHLCLGDRSKAKESSRISSVEDRRGVASPVGREAPLTRAAELTRVTNRESSEPTGRTVNVAGIWGTFECVEYRLGEVLEVHVHQIDENGRKLAPPSVHREPFESVIGTYIDVTAW
jgi:hypothetical protein